MEQVSFLLDGLLAIVDGVANHYDWFFGLLTATVGSNIVFRRMRPSWRLLRASLFHGQPFAGLRAGRELLTCLYYRPRTESLFGTARLRIETEILHPRPAPDMPLAPVPTHSASPAERRQLRQTYRAKRTLA